MADAKNRDDSQATVIEIRASLSALMLFRNPIERARWREGVAALLAMESIEDAVDLALNRDGFVRFIEAIGVANQLLDTAKRQYAWALQIGASFGEWVRAARSGEGISLSEAMRRHARPVRIGLQRRLHLAAGARENNEPGGSALEKRWHQWRSVAHLCAAHIEFSTQGLCSCGGPLSLPCDSAWLPEFFSLAESLRQAAIAFRLPCAEKLLDPHSIVTAPMFRDGSTRKSHFRDRSQRSGRPNKLKVGTMDGTDQMPFALSLISEEQRELFRAMQRGVATLCPSLMALAREVRTDGMRDCSSALLPAREPNPVTSIEQEKL